MDADAFTADLLRCCRDEATRRALRAVLTAWGGARVYLPVPRDTRPIDAAEKLRAVGTSRSDAAAILAERFGLSRRHCRRIVAQVFPDSA